MDLDSLSPMCDTINRSWSKVMGTKTIYNMALHEETQIDADTYVMRVAGGWLYSCYNSVDGVNATSTFVPFHNEFMGD